MYQKLNISYLGAKKHIHTFKGDFSFIYAVLSCLALQKCSYIMMEKNSQECKNTMHSIKGVCSNSSKMNHLYAKEWTNPEINLHWDIKLEQQQCTDNSFPWMPFIYFSTDTAAFLEQCIRPKLNLHLRREKTPTNYSWHEKEPHFHMNNPRIYKGWKIRSCKIGKAAVKWYGKWHFT